MWRWLACSIASFIISLLAFILPRNLPPNGPATRLLRYRAFWVRRISVFVPCGRPPSDKLVLSVLALPFRQGTRPWLDNNPGDIVSGPFTSRNGQLGTTGRFAVFPMTGTGREAMDTFLHGGGYINRNINDAVSKYAPAFENNAVRTTTAIQPLFLNGFSLGMRLHLVLVRPLRAH